MLTKQSWNYGKIELWTSCCFNMGKNLDFQKSICKGKYCNLRLSLLIHTKIDVRKQIIFVYSKNLWQPCHLYLAEIIIWFVSYEINSMKLKTSKNRGGRNKGMVLTIMWCIYKWSRTASSVVKWWLLKHYICEEIAKELMNIWNSSSAHSHSNMEINGKYLLLVWQRINHLLSEHRV